MAPVTGTIGQQRPGTAGYPRGVETPQAKQPREVKPLEVPVAPFALVGIAVWAVLGLVLLALHGWVSAHGHTRWLWTCLAGVLWGLLGLAVVARHDRRRRR
jgi:Protein of unknown function (DUF2530)